MNAQRRETTRTLRTAHATASAAAAAREGRGTDVARNGWTIVSVSPSPGTPGEGRGEGGSGRRVTQALEITLILTFSRRTGRRDQRANLACGRLVGVRRLHVCVHVVLIPARPSQPE